MCDYSSKKAFLCRLKGRKEVWIPKSVIADWEDYEVGDVDIELAIKDWFVNQEKLV